MRKLSIIGIGAGNPDYITVQATKALETLDVVFLIDKGEEKDELRFLPEDLVKFGLIPEFIGRLPVIATLTDLDEEALITILTAPKNALVKQYQRLFDLEDVKLTFTDDALKAIARRAIKRKTGARGLRSIMEDILLDSMFELPGLDSVTEVVVNEEAVDNPAAKPLQIHAEMAKKEPAAAG